MYSYNALRTILQKKKYDFIIKFFLLYSYRAYLQTELCTKTTQQVLTNRPNDIQQPVWDIISQTGQKKKKEQGTKEISCFNLQKLDHVNPH